MNEAAVNSLDNTTPALGTVSARPAAQPFQFPRMTRRLREWLRTLHHDPTAEERAADERRARLLVNNPYSD